jgi:peptide/nickel transport system substrate-binding protein
LLNGTAEPSVGWLKTSDPNFGTPQNRYSFDAARGRRLLAEAGFTAQRPLAFKVMISTSGSGQMLPLPMNEFIQQNLREACGVNVTFEVTEWNTLLNATRAAPGATNEAEFNAAYAAAHTRLVDNPPWLYIVHDLNPRAMTRRVRNFVSPQSWFVDLVPIDLQ